MKKYIAVLLVSGFAFSACRHKKEVVQVTTISVPPDKASAYTANAALPDSVPVNDNYRFIISFYSIGEGRDEMAHRSFISYLKEYKQKGRSIYAEEAAWGREGEVDYCMKLTELSGVEQREFISNLKTQLAEARWVHYFENKPCSHKN
jgi:hypothetical protein